MDAEHRHELKTNELAKWIKNFPQWLKDNTKTLIYAAIVIALVAGSFLYHRKKVDNVSEKKLNFTQAATALPQTKTRIVQARAQGMDLAHTLLTVADDMADLATKAESKDMAAMAYLKRGDALRTELHYRAGDVTQQDIELTVAQAKESYNNALAQSPANPLFNALATLGLGLCEEEIGNFDGAKEIYKKIIETPAFEGTTAAVLATTRLSNINDFKQKITFKPAPVLIDPNAPQAMTIDVNDINLPSQ